MGSWLAGWQLGRLAGYVTVVLGRPKSHPFVSERGRVSKNGAWTFGRASVESGAFVVKQFEVVCAEHTAGYSLISLKVLGILDLGTLGIPVI